MAASSFHFYEKLFTKLNASLLNYVNDVAKDIIIAITPVATTLLTIYVVLWGWSMMRGVIAEPITDGVSRIIRLSVITALALNLGRYNLYISDFLFNTPDALAAYVAGGYSNTTGNVQYLDNLMSQMYDFGEAFRQKGMANPGIFPDFSMLIMAYAIWAVGVISTGYGAFLLALAKMSLSIILAIGPIFVLLTIFEGTKRFFDSWVGQALNAVFLTVLTAAAIKLIMTILQSYLTDASGVVVDPALDQAIPAIVLGLIGALVLVQLPAMASAIGGGAAIGTLGAVGWAYGKAKSGASSMRPTNLKRSLNKARSDVKIASNAAKAVGGAPMAVYRKVTGASKNRVSKA